ncbi:hypothetical protein AMQ83_12120, partial [Paenibacillus riograndensis]
MSCQLCSGNSSQLRPTGSVQDSQLRAKSRTQRLQLTLAKLRNNLQRDLGVVPLPTVRNQTPPAVANGQNPAV